MKLSLSQLPAHLSGVIFALLGVYYLSQSPLSGPVPMCEPAPLPTEAEQVSSIASQLSPIPSSEAYSGTVNADYYFLEKRSLPTAFPLTGLSVKIMSATSLSRKKRNSLYETLDWPYFPTADDLMLIRIVNASPEARFIGESYEDMDIQREALTPEGKWEAIEHYGESWRSDSFCGTMYVNRKIRKVHLSTGQFLQFGAFRSKGDYHTLLRVKVRVGDQIIVSAPYAGSVSAGHFRRFDPKQGKNADSKRLYL